MRFWQKTYLFTLILFLICMNAGVLSLTIYTHNKNTQTLISNATAQQHYIALSFERDYKDLLSFSYNSSPELLMQSYCNHYGKTGIYLDFIEQTQSIESSIPFEYETQKNTLSYAVPDGNRHILISSDICDGKYVLTYSKNIESLDAEFRSLVLLYVVTSVGVSVFLAICLYFILKKLSTPLENLRKTTELIEGGDFTVVADESGNDEVSMLAHSFNSMLSTINQQIRSLKDNAQKKQMLVDDLAHELRTPLTSIRGYAEYLEKASSSEENRITAAKYIISEAARLQRISEILLDAAYIRENPPKFCSVNVSQVISDTAQKLSQKAKKHNVKIELDTDDSHVIGNETLLSMLIYNLCENAIKACAADGCVKITLKENILSVSDNGKGMTAEQLSHITEPFYRTDKSRSRAEGGAGLGLSLCLRIIEVHGADMSFSSEIGSGTLVTVTFTS